MAEYVLLDSTMDGVRREKDGTFSVPLATYRSRRDAKAGIRGQKEADAFNARAPIGTPVEYWTGLREGAGKTSSTRTAASVMPSGHAVVWVEDHASCISLSHVRVCAPAVA